LDVVRKVFGSSFGVGVLQPLPSMKTLKANPSVSGTVWLRNSDPVRIISCCSEGGGIVDQIAKPMYHNLPNGKKGRKPMKIMCSYQVQRYRFSIQCC
jgi:hypothetical protein